MLIVFTSIGFTRLFYRAFCPETIDFAYISPSTSYIPVTFLEAHCCTYGYVYLWQPGSRHWQKP